jgi:hypothetical protein
LLAVSESPTSQRGSIGIYPLFAIYQRTCSIAERVRKPERVVPCLAFVPSRHDESVIGLSASLHTSRLRSLWQNLCRVHQGSAGKLELSAAGAGRTAVLIQPGVEESTMN